MVLGRKGGQGARRLGQRSPRGRPSARNGRDGAGLDRRLTTDMKWLLVEKLVDDGSNWQLRQPVVGSVCTVECERCWRPRRWDLRVARADGHQGEAHGGGRFLSSGGLDGTSWQRC
jgi:hypothetical protein